MCIRDRITIDASGKINIDAMADAQDVYVRVSSTSGGMNDSKKLTIKSSDIFEINKFGFEDEDKTKFKRIDVTKNFNYSDEVTFVAATYNLSLIHIWYILCTKETRSCCFGRYRLLYTWCNTSSAKR